MFVCGRGVGGVCVGVCECVCGGVCVCGGARAHTGKCVCTQQNSYSIIHLLGTVQGLN